MDRNEKQNSYRNRKNTRGSQRTIRQLKKKNRRMAGVTIALAALVCALAGLNAYQYIHPFSDVQTVSGSAGAGNDTATAEGNANEGDGQEDDGAIQILSTEGSTEAEAQAAPEDVTESVAGASSEDADGKEESTEEAKEKVTEPAETEAVSEEASEKVAEELTEAQTEPETESAAVKEMNALLADKNVSGYMLVKNGRTVSEKESAGAVSGSAQIARPFIMGTMYQRLSFSADHNGVAEDGEIVNVYNGDLNDGDTAYPFTNFTDLAYSMMQRERQGETARGSEAATRETIWRIGASGITSPEQIDLAQHYEKGIALVNQLVGELRGDTQEAAETAFQNASEQKEEAEFESRLTVSDSVSFFKEIAQNEKGLWNAGYLAELQGVLSAQTVSEAGHSHLLTRILSAAQQNPDRPYTVYWTENATEKGFETVFMTAPEGQAPSVFAIFSPEDTGEEWAEKLASLVWKEMTGEELAAEDQSAQKQTEAESEKKETEQNASDGAAQSEAAADPYSVVPAEAENGAGSDQGDASGAEAEAGAEDAAGADAAAGEMEDAGDAGTSWTGDGNQAVYTDPGPEYAYGDDPAYWAGEGPAVYADPGPMDAPGAIQVWNEA